MDPGLKIITGNRLEILVAQLAGVVRTPLSAPLAPEIIVVQSSGMQRWVSMALAAHNGICANVAFPFPNRFLHDIFKRVLPEIPEQSLFEPRTLGFAIMRQLPHCTDTQGFEELQRYLATDPSDLKLLQLSEKIADLFDQYLVFRPDSISAWEAGKEASDPATRWQAHLWRNLAAGHETEHRAALHRTLIEALRSPAAPPPDLPERISIFGISYLPPFYLQALAEIARRVPVRLFLLNPCREYWADILSEQEKKRVEARHADMAEGQADLLHLDPGHRLLASLGALGRDFFAQLVALDADYHEYFEDPVPSDILSSLQADIFNLRDRAAAGLQGSIAPQDSSIQIHSCHGPMREVEVLHDNLLAMLEASPNLAPGDIIVMAPDIEVYASFIRAVFDAQADEGLRIPYSIADQSTRRESRVIDAFFTLLDLPRGRFNAPEVLALLECHGIQQTFDWTPSDARTAARWIRETRVRWGIDAPWRQRIGLPLFEDNSWQSGLQRLLLGYAMPGSGRETFGGILPYDNIEGGEAPTLGKLLRFVERLFPLFDNLKSNFNLERWKESLGFILENFFTETAETQRELLALRHAVDTLAAQQTAAAYEGEVSVEVVRHFLEQYFRQEGGGGGFITGGVTFCSLLPMRSIPFQTVCLLGMNADAFPREAMHPSFDLIVRHPRPGDRSRRNDDKYLFLEALISARQTLYISYVGQNLQDNTPIPPSVIVSELLDYLTQGYAVETAQIVTTHKLQAFAPDYFKDESAVGDRLFSYSDENLLAAERLVDRPAPPVFFDAPLAEPGTAWKNLTLQQLCAFYANPVRFLLQRRLGVFLDDATPLVDERENFTLRGLERYHLEQDLVDGNLAGTEGGVLFALEKAAGRLPPGTVGQVVYGDLNADADSFARRVRSYCDPACPPTTDLQLTVDDFTLTGPIASLHAEELIRFRYARLKPSDLLTTWILHLARNAGFPADPGNRSLLLVKNGLWEFQPLPDARKVLQELLNLYWQGMRAPLAFFPAAALAYARQVFVAGKSREVALQSAEKTWQGGEFKRGESEDPYFHLCFAPPAPLGETFCQLAEAVFAPLLQAAIETPV